MSAALTKTMRTCQTSRASLGQSRRSVSCFAARVGDNVPSINKGKQLGKTGWMETDASGTGNVYPTMPKTFLKSQRSEKAATAGIGGLQGVLIVAAVIGVVAFSSVPVVRQETGETLTQVVESYTGDSLSEISQRISASL